MPTQDTHFTALPVGEGIHPVMSERLTSVIGAINRAQKLSADADAEFRRDWQGIDAMIERDARKGAL